jgi:hypothetical protein
MMLICLWIWGQNMGSGQPVQAPEEPSITAHILTQSGKKITLTGVTVGGGMGNELLLDQEGVQTTLDLASISTLEMLDFDNGRSPCVATLESGEQLKGGLRRFSLRGMEPGGDGGLTALSGNEIRRIQVVRVDKIRHCGSCGYEEFTSYPFCPVCGSQLEDGPEDGLNGEDLTAPPVHVLRVDERDPVVRQ